MACPKCTLRLIRQPKKPRIALPTASKRSFHASPSHSRLGAFTYAQEWQTGTYHYNKALGKTLPVASQRADELLTNYATQRKRHLDPANPLYTQLTRQSIAHQRRQQDRILIGKTTAKEFVDRVELTAFVFDGVEAAAAEKEAFLKKLKAKKEGQSGEGSSGTAKRGPTARRRVVGGAMAGAALPGARRTGGSGGDAPRRPGGFAGGAGGRSGGFGAPSRGVPGIGNSSRNVPGVGNAFRSVPGIGSATKSTPPTRKLPAAGRPRAVGQASARGQQD